MQHPAWTHNTLAQVAFLGKIGNQQIVNNLHFEASGARQAQIAADGDHGDDFVSDLLDDLVGNLWLQYINALPNDYVANSITGRVIAYPAEAHTNRAVQERTNAPARNAGAGAGADALSTAKLLQLRTPLGGKSHRGRIYLPCARAEVTDGTLDAGNGAATAARTALVAAITNRYIGAHAFTADVAFLTVFSKPLHIHEQQWAVRVAGQLQVRSNPAAYAGNSTGVTLVRFDPTARTIRRREVGVGS